MSTIKTYRDRKLAELINRELISMLGRVPTPHEIQVVRSRFGEDTVYKYQPQPEQSDPDRFNQDFESIKLDLDLMHKDILIQVEKAIQQLLFGLARGQGVRRRIDLLKRYAIEGIHKRKREVQQFLIRNSVDYNETTCEVDALGPAIMVPTKESLKINLGNSAVNISPDLDESGARNNMFVDELDKVWTGRLTSSSQEQKTCKIAIVPRELWTFNKITLSTIGAYEVHLKINGSEVYASRQDTSKHFIRFPLQQINRIEIEMLNDDFEYSGTDYNFYWGIRSLICEKSILSSSGTFSTQSLDVGTKSDTLRIVPTVSGYDDITWRGVVTFDNDQTFTTTLPPGEEISLGNTSEVSATIDASTMTGGGFTASIKNDLFANKPLIEITHTTVIPESVRIIRSLDLFVYESFKIEKLDDRFEPNLDDWSAGRKRVGPDFLDDSSTGKFGGDSIFEDVIDLDQTNIELSAVEKYEYGIMNGWLWAKKDTSVSFEIGLSSSATSESTNVGVAIYVNGSQIGAGTITGASTVVPVKFDLRRNKWNLLQIVIFNFGLSSDEDTDSVDFSIRAISGDELAFLNTNPNLVKSMSSTELQLVDMMRVLTTNDPLVFAVFDDKIYLNLTAANLRSGTNELESDIAVRGKALRTASSGVASVVVSATLNSDDNHDLTPILNDVAIEFSRTTSYPLEIV